MATSSRFAGFATKRPLTRDDRGEGLHPQAGRPGAAMEAFAPRVPVVTVVHASACHLCVDTLRVLSDLVRSRRITVELIDARETRGQVMVRLHRPAMFPLVLVDGEVFSAGRLPRAKLQALLNRRAALV